MPKTAISVIIPAYQVKDYLPSCLDSLLNQDFTQPYKIILVESGATDGTDLVCKEYEERYPGIIYYFHYDTNDGVSVGRNVGIGHSVGSYVTFVDGDDLVEKNYLSRLYDEAVKGNYQIVSCAHVLSADGKKKGYGNRHDFKGRGRKAILKCHPNFQGYCWGKLYSREFLMNNRLQFTPHVDYYEDWLFLFESLYQAENVRYLNDPLYIYRTRKGSAMDIVKDTLSWHLKVIALSLEYVKSKNPQAAKELFKSPSITLKHQIKLDAASSKKNKKEAINQLLNIYDKAR